MNPENFRELLGPLTTLMGTWEGDKGDDIAPSDDRGTENNKFRERLVLESIGPVQNHEQNLHVLRYSTKAWRIGEENTFHEEVGYWSWEPETRLVMRSFLIPRGISVIAGGFADKDTREFTLKSESGSTIFGICANPFLDREFKTLSYEVKITLIDADTFSYDEVTVLQIAGRKEPFQHRDRNVLRRVKS